MSEHKYSPEETKLLSAIFGEGLKDNDERLLKSTHRKPTMRKVEGKVYRHGKWEEISGTFHQWGMTAHESQEGNMQWTVAIIELSDGSIVMASPENVKFIQ